MFLSETRSESGDNCYLLQDGPSTIGIREAVAENSHTDPEWESISAPTSIFEFFLASRRQGWDYRTARHVSVDCGAASRRHVLRAGAELLQTPKRQRGRPRDRRLYQRCSPPQTLPRRIATIAFKLRRDVTLLCGHQMVPDSVLNQFGIALSAKYFHHPVLVIRNRPARHLEDTAHLLHYPSFRKQLQYLTLPWS